MAAVSSAFGRAGWRLLQLRCLPGEGAAEAGSGVERGGGARPTWAGCGAEEAVAAAREQGEVKDTGAGPPASRDGRAVWLASAPVSRCEGPGRGAGLSLPFNGRHEAPERAAGAQGHTARASQNSAGLLSPRRSPRARPGGTAGDSRRAPCPLSPVRRRPPRQSSWDALVPPLHCGGSIVVYTSESLTTDVYLQEEPLCHWRKGKAGVTTRSACDTSTEIYS